MKCSLVEGLVQGGRDALALARRAEYPSRGVEEALCQRASTLPAGAARAVSSGLRRCRGSTTIAFDLTQLGGRRPGGAARRRRLRLAQGWYRVRLCAPG